MMMLSIAWRLGKALRQWMAPSFFARDIAAGQRASARKNGAQKGLDPNPKG